MWDRSSSRCSVITCMKCSLQNGGTITKSSLTVTDHCVLLLVSLTVLELSKQLLGESCFLIQHFSWPFHFSLGFFCVCVCEINFTQCLFLLKILQLYWESQWCSMIPHSRSNILSKESGQQGSPVSVCLFHFCILFLLHSDSLLPKRLVTRQWLSSAELH